MSKLIMSILRALQLLCAGIILGLSIKLARGQESVVLDGKKDNRGRSWPGVPATTAYVCFVGGFTILAGLVGTAAIFLSFLDGIVTWALDGLAALFLLAGGIAAAVGLGGTDCAHARTLNSNHLLNCGTVPAEKGKPFDSYSGCGAPLEHPDQAGPINDRCRMYKADDAFLFIGLITTAAAVVLSFMAKRRNKTSGFV